MAEAPVVLLGSADRPLPRHWCACRTCLSLAAPLAPSSLRVDGTTVQGSSVDGRMVAAGVTIQSGGLRVIGLPLSSDPVDRAGQPQGEAALVLAGPRTGTILWSPGQAPLHPSALEALRGAELDVVALGVGADGQAIARSLALLRRVGALARRCDVVAVGFDHTTARDRLTARISGWGARLAPDGTPLGPAHALSARTLPRRTLVLGPASSGKSAFAESILAAEPEVDYLPTGPVPGSDDPDWAARVAVHRGRRPPWWRTLEGVPPVAALGETGPPLLLDSVGLWVSAALARCGAWDNAPGWQQAFDVEADAVVGAWRQAGRQVVAVAEEAGWGVVPPTPAGRRFRDALSRVNRRLADESERVILVAAGRATDLAEGMPGV